MAKNDESPSASKLPVLLKPIDFDYAKPNRRNDLVPVEKYNQVDSQISDLAMLGTNGVLYVPQEAFPTVFQTTKAKAQFILDNQIDEEDTRTFGGQRYAHSSAVVGLADKKAQETRDAGKQALFQYARDSLVTISDSPQAQEARRQLDAFSAKMLPKLRNERNILVDEVTGEAAQKGFAFHHVNPKELHTDPEDSLDPTKGRNLNQETHADVHRKNINSEEQFEAYKKQNAPKAE